MEPDLEILSQMFPKLSSQLRLALHQLQLAAAQLVPAAQREKDPELDARAAVLDQSYYRILRLVNELSATAWFSQEKKARLKNVDLVELVQQIFASAESLAQLTGHDLHLICPKDTLLCAVDRGALEQVLYHLLSNALKFTPAGGHVTLEVQFASREVRILVSDTGCGIPQELLRTLFSRCLTEEDLPVPPHGAGLGLMLCRRIAQVHGGTLTAVSKVGKGSIFTLTLPVHLVNQIGISDVPFAYEGGFNPALLNLADALPAAAFRIRSF